MKRCLLLSKFRQMKNIKHSLFQWNVFNPGFSSVVNKGQHVSLNIQEETLNILKTINYQQQAIDQSYKIPDYIKCYTWAYIQPQLVRLWDHIFFVNILLFGQYGLLKKKFLQEFNKHDRVLQLGSTYWDICPSLAKHLDSEYKVIDVLPIQADRCNYKLRCYKQAYCVLGDACDANQVLQQDERIPYDKTASFFLMHELPNHMKKMAITNLLKAVKPGGKAVFIEYHKPKKNSFFWYYMPVYFWAIEPYAKDIWDTELLDFVDSELKNQFSVKKETYFFDLYQKVVAVRNI